MISDAFLFCTRRLWYYKTFVASHSFTFLSLFSTLTPPFARGVPTVRWFFYSLICYPRIVRMERGTQLTAIVINHKNYRSLTPLYNLLRGVGGEVYDNCLTSSQCSVKLMSMMKQILMSKLKVTCAFIFVSPPMRSCTWPLASI